VAINLKLNPVRDVDAQKDDMGRRWVGFQAEHSPQQTYDQNRGVWLFGPRAARERYATFSFEGTVRVVVEIDGIETISSKNPSRPDKSAIVGRVLGEGHPMHQALMGTPVDAHRNPVTYPDDPADGPRNCACGCGAPVPSHRAFAPGHDQRAVHERITRQWGSTLGFIGWYDATYPLAPMTEG